MTKFLQFIAVVLVALAVSYGVQQYLESSQRAQNHALCLALNRGRVTANKRIKSEIVMRDTLVSFAQQAAAARLASYARQGDQTDRVAAMAYARDAKNLANIPFPLLPPLTCPT